MLNCSVSLLSIDQVCATAYPLQLYIIMLFIKFLINLDTSAATLYNNNTLGCRTAEIMASHGAREGNNALLKVHD